MKRNIMKERIMKEEIMKGRILIIVLCLLCNGLMQAQVGMMTNNPDKSAILDMKDASNKGLLIPNVNLATTTFVSGINGGVPAQSLLVYNTNGGITGAGAAGTGYYFWDVNIWKKLATSSEASGGVNTEWYLAGTTTDAGSNKTGYINRTGRVGIGLTGFDTPNAPLHVNSGSAGAIKIVDGTEGDGRVLTCDFNGLATWQTKGPQTVQGTVPSSNQVWAGNSSYHYSGYYIDVPPGRSTVTAGIVFVGTGNGYVTCRLSTSSGSMGSFPSNVTPNLSGFTVVNGTSTGQVLWYVNNTSGYSQRFYMWLGAAAGAATAANVTVGGSSNYLESFIMAAY